MKQRTNVNNLAHSLFEVGVIPEPVIVGWPTQLWSALFRRRKKYWTYMGHDKPRQIIVTDGATQQHLDSNAAVEIEYHVLDDPSYVLVVEWKEERLRWVIHYACFFSRNWLRSDKLMYQLRIFSNIDLAQGQLESMFEQAKHRPNRS